MNPVSNVPPEPCLDRVIGRFPYWKSLIERECERSETFHTLCDDWLVCSNAFQRWRSAESSLAQSRRNEYRTLMAELEGEIAAWLEGAAQPDASPTDQE